MAGDALNSAEANSPLEIFLRDYADTTGGLWEEVEPQVYDLMFAPGADDLAAVAGADVVRLAFGAADAAPTGLAGAVQPGHRCDGGGEDRCLRDL